MALQPGTVRDCVSFCPGYHLARRPVRSAVRARLSAFRRIIFQNTKISEVPTARLRPRPVLRLSGETGTAP
jgi:hypothetical protein